ncbi:MAG: hypothetical protein EOP55_01390 [Sphingobacteriales bacterium]|nr:MAG: hypothetical protein EOP55_01390 [Sphingobacteriales bacterium]
MHNYFSQIIRLLIIVLLFCNPAFAQQTNPHSKTISKFDSIRNNFPREKLYVQIDKSLYAPQDTLWFKAYLVNASTLEASKISGLIYFEMFDQQGNNIQRICLPTAMGLTWGGFALKPDLYKTGTYTFRAYTNWMQNFSNSYIFKKEIKIADFFTDENTYVADKKKPSVTKTQNTVSTSKANDFDIQFLPEGGNWTSNVMQKMAFKAINSLGKGVQVSGEVFDSKQNKIVDFHSNDKGMGYFNIMPAANETYTANIKLNETAKKQNLPKTSQSASFLKVNNDFRSDSLAINMFADLPNQEITMMGQSRGNLCFIAKFNSGRKYNTVHIAKSIFPTGVCQIMLINGKNQVINERNLFINHKDELKIQLRSEQTEYHTRDSICISLTANTFLSKPVSGSFSVAVTDDNQVSKDSLNDNNILSQFLLASDLKGEIETPGYYFNNFNEQKHNDLEALMLTQAWVSYNWESTKKPVFKAEKDFTISGRIT